MTLYLLPNVLGPVEDVELFLPKSVAVAMSQIDGLIAESTGEGRRYLKHFSTKKKAHEMPIALLSEEVDFLLEPVQKGEVWGVVSDAGLPCLADPGALLVRRARGLNLHVEALSGPSSITLALMLSGLSGQHFFFHGYIPKTPEEREKALREWEKMRGVTHIFIEAPYRNQHTFQTCMKVLQKDTLLCVASNLTLSDQLVQMAPIGKWKEIEIGKKPTIFLFFRAS